MGGRTYHEDDNRRRERLNPWMVGDPGTAKFILATEAKVNSKF
jgi:hypothetical protein